MQRDPSAGFSKEFSVSHDLTEQQKREQEINMLRDKKEREKMLEMKQMRDEKAKIARDEIERQKEAIIKHEVQKQALDLKMKSTDQKRDSHSLEQKLRSKVQALYGPELDAHVKRVEKDLDKIMRKELREATFRDNKPEVTQKPGGNPPARDMPRER